MTRPNGVRALTEDERQTVVRHLHRIAVKHGTFDTRGAVTAVARDTGISQQSISQMLAGAPIGMFTARKVADFVGMTLDELLGTGIPVFDTLIEQYEYRWSAYTTAAARNMPRVEALDEEAAMRLLDSIEAALKPISKSVRG